MKKVIFVSLVALGLAACSTTKSNTLSANTVDTESSEQKICFYQNKPGWKMKEKHCLTKQSYYERFTHKDTGPRQPTNHLISPPNQIRSN
ncbi:putative periplasmic lipoprotein [Kangiella aquimarina]|uniref:Lipoprotein n=1 Tax=Kangiella aquimarina TaxID=261965 RepID=A0ABZ0X507_9GAMM|nr:hypothetical protein [Kangiella aquimarina]WQG85673.1 hypothetical protein SR900_02025 [Kangiella aquimarina]